ncbi:MAG: hypothetical protein V5A88_06380 [Candidatus Thermoplasmatota archaeon]
MMERSKIAVIILVGVLIFLTISVYGYTDKREDTEEEWVHYTPEEESVSISIDTEGDEIVAEVTIVFRDLGYRVEDWGEVSRDDGVISVNTEIERWTGPSAKAIKEVENSYTLGELEEGDYEFRFKAWDEVVKPKEFTV